MTATVGKAEAADVFGGVNFGIGAHADVGYKDGVLKCDIGASLGVGVSLDVEIDISGMVETVNDFIGDGVETVVDKAGAVWEDIQDGWNDFWNW